MERSHDCIYQAATSGATFRRISGTVLTPVPKALRRARLPSEGPVRGTPTRSNIRATTDTIVPATFSWVTNREKGVPLDLSIVWMLSLALFVVHQIRFWAKKMPLAISIAAWLLYAALVYLRIVP